MFKMSYMQAYRFLFQEKLELNILLWRIHLLNSIFLAVASAERRGNVKKNYVVFTFPLKLLLVYFYIYAGLFFLGY